jgi:prepilin-type N-terminal cleavage/methylation domain-containing protein
MKSKGFTLMELLIVMAILMILIIILIGIINPASLVGKANDSRRKKDLDAIRKSFEEYFNDKGVYPIDIGNWNIKTNCKSSIFNSYLNP